MENILTYTQVGDVLLPNLTPPEPAKRAPVNDTEKVLPVIVPVSLRQLIGDLFQLFRKSVFAGDAIASLQSGGHGLLMLRAVLPQPGAAGVLL